MKKELSEYTTFRLGGPCQELISCSLPSQLKEIVRQLREHQKKFILIGGGSNLLVSDEGVDCIVVRYVSDLPVFKLESESVVVSASTKLDDIVGLLARRGFQGLNTCSGIPGTVGGAVIGNAGAFGKQVGDVLEWVELILPSGEIIQRSAEELDFCYRSSNLKESDAIVTEVCFRLVQGDNLELLRERKEILTLRKEKHPNLNLHPCAGSFFRNIEPTSKAQRRQAAGAFLEDAGVKSFSVGGATTFSKHANIIVKGDCCSSQDVYDLSLKMARAVKEKFHFDLVREVKCVGAFKGSPDPLPSLIW